MTPATILRAEAESLRSLAVMFRSKPGQFSQIVGASLAVKAADFEAEALKFEGLVERKED
jgi:hypothetical protein